MLRVEGLRRSVGDFRLRVDNWEVAAGTYLVLVGPSGAGKTVLLETLAGIGPPDAGRVWIDSRPATDVPPESRGIGFVYQDGWLFPHMTVRQNIDFARRYHQQETATKDVPTAELAETLGIHGLLDRKPQTLSGGERQRVALARALSIRPRMMFLDEPLGMLDPATREAVAVELQKCHRLFGTTTIHVTHDHTEARFIGDQVAVILNGTLEQTGPADQVFRRPRTQALARFLGCENMFECEAVAGARPGETQILLGNRRLIVPSVLSGRVLACVRPEEVLVRPVKEESAQIASFVCRGVLTEVSERGPLLRLIVEAEGLRWVSLIGRSGHEADRYGVGVSVVVAVRHESVHLAAMES